MKKIKLFVDSSVNPQAKVGFGAFLEVFDDLSIVGLQNRKEKLEANDYKSSTGKTINNYELYKLFFEKIEKLDIDFIKIKGHKKNSLKDELDTIFNLVDKASRRALRKNFI